jgi:hypothetical protein
MIVVGKALREEPQLLGRAANTARQAGPGVLTDRDVTDVAMDVRADEAQADLLNS